jgi:hypothetical protein
MTHEEHLTGDDPPQYPTVTISARVYRYPNYILLNVLWPTFQLLVMAYLQFLVPTYNQEVRLAVTLTLVLTSSANRLGYKYMLCARPPARASPRASRAPNRAPTARPHRTPAPPHASPHRRTPTHARCHTLEPLPSSATPHRSAHHPRGDVTFRRLPRA